MIWKYNATWISSLIDSSSKKQNQVIDDDNIISVQNIDDDVIFDHSETDAGNVTSVQNITNTIHAYTSPALSFSTNTLANMIDPSNIEIPFCVYLERGDEKGWLLTIKCRWSAH